MFKFVTSSEFLYDSLDDVNDVEQNVVRALQLLDDSIHQVLHVQPECLPWSKVGRRFCANCTQLIKVGAGRQSGQFIFNVRARLSAHTN